MIADPLPGRSPGIALVGGRLDDEMILDRTATRADGSTVRQRMRWWDIAPDTFSWDSLHASDDSAEWDLRWRRRYTRVSVDLADHDARCADRRT